MVIGKLQPFLSERRVRRLESVIAARLKGVAVLLEGIYDHGNAVAIMRTCEALGVHRVHLLNLPEKYKSAKKVGQGAQKWLDVSEHGDVARAVASLRQQGYRLVASHLDADRTLDDLDVDRPLALIFGNEHAGVSDELLAHCDEHYVIPMEGYSQSLNVSCAAAIALHTLVKRYRQRLGRAGDLSQAERERVRELFYRRAVRKSDLLLDELNARGE